MSLIKAFRRRACLRKCWGRTLVIICRCTGSNVSLRVLAWRWSTCMTSAGRRTEPADIGPHQAQARRIDPRVARPERTSVARVSAHRSPPPGGKAAPRPAPGTAATAQAGSACRRWVRWGSPGRAQTHRSRSGLYLRCATGGTEYFQMRAGGGGPPRHPHLTRARASDRPCISVRLTPRSITGGAGRDIERDHWRLCLEFRYAR
ncbi:hypothetical protein PSP31121_05563 [Pandoraea sputorum]|uniref:Uncharacterized protein n=1 Tax=Pandoraea sputorum TaxID=93222 RepID=A0A5E5BNQ3_9BURK|nr:hypothetical protein PSP31121_05563 [Pandoraea sputorum]